MVIHQRAGIVVGEKSVAGCAWLADGKGDFQRHLAERAGKPAARYQVGVVAAVGVQFDAARQIGGGGLEGRQGVGKACQCGFVQHDPGVDLPDLCLELPVGVQRLVAGEVVGGGDIGAAQLCQGFDEQRAGFVGGQLAAVDQDIGIGFEGIVPRTDGRCLGDQIVGADALSTQADLARCAVRDDMHGIDILLLRQGLTDELQAVLSVFDKHQLQLAGRVIAQAVDDLLIIGRGAVDEHQLQGLRGLVDQRRFAVQAVLLDKVFDSRRLLGNRQRIAAGQVHRVQLAWLERLENRPGRVLLAGFAKLGRHAGR